MKVAPAATIAKPALYKETKADHTIGIAKGIAKEPENSPSISSYSYTSPVVSFSIVISSSSSI